MTATLIRETGYRKSLYCYNGNYFVISSIETTNRVEVMSFRSDSNGVVSNYRNLAEGDCTAEVIEETIKVL